VPDDSGTTPPDDSGGTDDSGDDTGTFVDADGDGAGAAVDCDDANAAIHPGAVELCNEIDDDCDGGIDFGVRVPLDFAFLDDAVEATPEGGTVCIGAGTYEAGLALEQDISIVGGGPALTTLVADGADRTLTFAEVDATVSGLTLGPGEQGTLELWDSNVRLEDVAVDELRCDTAYCLGAFAFVADSSLAIDGLVGDRLDVTCSSDWYGVFFVADGTSELTIANMSITDGTFGSTGSSTWGAIVYAPLDSPVQISDSLFEGNEFVAESWLYGASYGFNRGYAGVAFVDNEFSAPSVLLDYTIAYGALRASHLLFAGNEVSYTNHHYGFYTLEGSIDISNSIFAGNRGEWTGSGTGYGRALVSNNQGTLWLTNVDFVGNTLDGDVVEAAGVWATGGSTSALDNVSFASNEIDGDSEAASCFKDEGSHALSYVNTHDNSGGAGPMRDYSSALSGTSLTTGDPMYTALEGDPATWDLHPQEGSALEDAGDPDLTDPDGSRADIGAYGGPAGTWP
jgi:hypothetical protein